MPFQLLYLWLNISNEKEKGPSWNSITPNLSNEIGIKTKTCMTTRDEGFTTMKMEVR